jgi:hypothetical protein
MATKKRPLYGAAAASKARKSGSNAQSKTAMARQVQAQIDAKKGEIDRAKLAISQLRVKKAHIRAGKKV